MKKIGMGIVIILLIAVAFALGFFLGDTVLKPKTEESNANVVEEVIDINLDEVVTELSNESDKVLNKPVTFRFPRITLEKSSYAKVINDDITKLKSKAEEAKKKVKTEKDVEDYLKYIDFDYSYFEEDGILTILISHGLKDSSNSENGKFYKVYNLDLATGNEVSNIELFQRAGESMDEFSEKIEEYAKKYIDPTSGSRQISYIRGNSLEIDNCEFYVKDGHLIALVKAEGTDYAATYRIDMTTGELEKF